MPRQLELRVAYLSRRFALHAPFWQCVIWLRQLGLFFAAVGAELAVTHIDGFTEPAAYRAAYIVFAVFAAMVVAVAWAAHARTQPYAYQSQNTLETC
eukprot:6166692-Prymnesium_polylepis.1